MLWQANSVEQAQRHGSYELSVEVSDFLFWGFLTERQFETVFCTVGESAVPRSPYMGGDLNPLSVEPKVFGLSKFIVFVFYSFNLTFYLLSDFSHLKEMASSQFNTFQT